jgi:hypothetical protein
MGAVPTKEEVREAYIQEAAELIREFEGQLKTLKNCEADKWYVAKKEGEFKALYGRIIGIRVGSDAEELLTRYSRVYQAAARIINPSCYTNPEGAEPY